jgi:hypothetical protein
LRGWKIKEGRMKEKEKENEMNVKWAMIIWME